MMNEDKSQKSPAYQEFLKATKGFLDSAEYDDGYVSIENPGNNSTLTAGKMDGDKWKVIVQAGDNIIDEIYIDVPSSKNASEQEMAALSLSFMHAMAHTLYGGTKYIDIMSKDFLEAYPANEQS